MTPCKRGHTSGRDPDGRCSECRRIQKRDYLARHRSRCRELSLESYHRLKNKNDPEWLARRHATSKRNDDKRREKRVVTDRVRQQTPEYKAADSARHVERYHAVLKHDPNYLEKRRIVEQNWIKKYPERKMASTAKRRASRLQATPPWLTPEMHEEIVVIYAEAAALTKMTGVEHDVHHSHALQGANFSGLHVPWNLEVLTASENRARGNRPCPLSAPMFSYSDSTKLDSLTTLCS